MEKFKDVHSKAIPLPLDEVDTDQIIPAAFLTSVSREGYGENLFRGMRDANAQFILNDPRMQGREVLVVGENFGCGSSREHAVWALSGYGIRVVIGKSFADIFSSNSAKNGLLLVQLAKEEVEELLSQLKRESAGAIAVSLATQEVRFPEGSTHSFDYDPFRKHCLLEGLDDIDYIQSKASAISSFRESQIRFAKPLERAA